MENYHCNRDAYSKILTKKLVSLQTAWNKITLRAMIGSLLVPGLPTPALRQPDCQPMGG